MISPEPSPNCGSRNLPTLTTFWTRCLGLPRKPIQRPHRNALDRVQRYPIESVSVEHQIAYYKELGKLPPAYLEKLMRETREEQNKLVPYICSMSADPGSLAMWSLYAERHAGIVFGISSKLSRVILEKGRIVYGMLYSPNRPHTAFNNPKAEDVAPTLWTKGLDWEH